MKQNQPNFQSTYQTGSTNPPKSHHGLIAVLLILVIVLCSVVTILGMMNIRLFKLLETQTKQAVSYEPKEQIAQVDVEPQPASLETDIPVLGLTCEEITSLYRSYHQLPQGLYITHIEPNSCADRAGLRAGDILITCDGNPITKKETFIHTISNLTADTTVTFTVFRDSQQLTIPLTVEAP